MFRKVFARIGAPQAAPPWGMGAALSSLVAAFAALILGSTVAQLLFPGAQWVVLAGWTLGAALTAAFVWITRRTRPERTALRLYETNAPLFLLLLVGLALALTLDVISLRATTQFLPDPELLGLYRQPLEAFSLLMALVLMALAQPVAEELVFRGVLLPALRAAVGSWPGFGLSALAYAVFHLLVYSPPALDFDRLWYGLLLPFVAGLIFGAVRVYTGSTRAAILTHMAFGLFAVVKLLTLAG